MQYFNPTYPNYPTYPMPYQNQQPTIQRKVDFVQGKISAETYPVNAGEEIILVDMDNPYVYRKARGFDNVLEPMSIYDLVEHKDEEVKQFDINDYAAELETKISKGVEKSMDQKIKEEVEKRLSEISFTPAKKTTTKKGE